MGVKLNVPGVGVVEYDEARAKLLIERRGYQVVEEARLTSEPTPEPNDAVTASSCDVKAKEAIAAIAELDDESAVYSYVEGEQRVSVRDAADERAEELREAGDEAGCEDGED